MYCKNKDATILVYRKDKKEKEKYIKRKIYMISSKKGVLILKQR